jgi:molecular chaperone HtpG
MATDSTKKTGKVTQTFQAEIKQLLDLMIHSLYSNRDIFLRELVSNASDAIDKLKFLALTDEKLIADNKNFEIRLEADESTQTLKIYDTGIGMTREEVIQNIGTIAHSGTKAFIQKSKELQNNPELIGQFGVGFYSAFMVADKVTMHTQKAGTSEGVLWESTGDGSYTIDDVPRAQGHGTTLTLHLKKFEEDDAKNYTDTFVLKGLIKKYSDFISHPIKMKIQTEKPVEGKEGEFEKVIEDEVLNSQKALWIKSPSEIKEEEYKEFYQHVSHDWNEPLKHIHFKAEGTLEFNSLLFIPKKRPYNYFYKDAEYGLSLYIKRVFIMSECKDLVPSYLRFLKGVVDSSDLSLNVSRELLQQDRQVTQIRKNLVTKVLNTLKDMMTKDIAQYENFWTEFGMTLKEGLTTDVSQKEKLADLTLWHSTHSDKMTSLEDYVARMKPEQTQIFYISGESLGQIQNSPYLETLKDKGYEVLLMIDPVDEWVTQSLTEYKGKKLQSVVKEDLNLDTEEQKKAKEEENKNYQESYKDLITLFKETLKDDIKEVKISDRLTKTPVCLVSSAYDPTANMERILAQFSKENPMGKTKRILEINPKHPVFEKMKGAQIETQKKWAEILYGQALLNEGSSLPDPVKFSQQVAELMLASQ